MLADLRCGSCHAGVPAPGSARGAGPGLTAAGVRYEPGFLVSYLKNPSRVRPGNGRARMPDFFFSDGEALAVSRFLEAQRRLGDAKSPSSPMRWPWHTIDRAAAERVITQQLKCTSCHSLNGQGGNAAPELAAAGARLSKEWLRRFIAAPHRYEPNVAMPAVLFDERDNRALVQDADGTLDLIVEYLVAIASVRRDSLARVRNEIESRNPAATAQAGEAIVRAQNCAGCHTINGMVPRASGPSLAGEGMRVQPQWLRAYLDRPTPIRLHGTTPGSGSRMPGYGLDSSERDSLLAFFATDSSVAVRRPPVALSPFATSKAMALLRDQMSCLGCHRIGEAGGEVGPDLSNTSARLRPEFVSRMIEDPAHASPGSFMPTIRMRETDASLIIAYVSHLSSGSDARRVPYPSLLASASIPAATGAAGVYATRCAPCHGVTGNGDGFNASRLPVPPLAHSSKAAMASRTDDRLYDGIAAGGRVLGDSPRMPAFGETLSQQEIAGLVRYLRVLCACEGPAWGRDATSRAGVAK